MQRKRCAYREAVLSIAKAQGDFCDVSSWSSNFLVLELYLLNTEAKENTDTACFAGCPGRQEENFDPGLRGYRRHGRPGVDEHFIHLNLDFSAKLIVRLIRIGC
jgi:hypothetical protein